jgi:predicted anti-sigma-YlaC factor YlaD
VDCTPFRDALSARLDGEPSAMRAEDVDRHLAGCTACRAWAADAATVTRGARVTAAEPVPDRTASILAAAGRLRPRRTQPQLLPSATTWRVALVALAAAHLALALPGLLDAASAGAAAHRASELAAFDAALGAGFLLAAWRPERAAGMAPLVAVAVVGLLLTSIAGLVAGRTDLVAESPHLLDLIGVLALVALGRAAPPVRRWTAFA